MTAVLELATDRAVAAIPAEPAEWRWIWVLPDPAGGWTVLQGFAEVSFGPHWSFTAVLVEEDADGPPTLELRGVVHGRRVVATGAGHAVHAIPWRFSGEIDRFSRDPQGSSQGWDADRIELRCGPVFVGLCRSSPPAP
jgi:hypothetical protein